MGNPNQPNNEQFNEYLRGNEKLRPYDRILAEVAIDRAQVIHGGAENTRKGVTEFKARQGLIPQPTASQVPTNIIYAQEPLRATERVASTEQANQGPNASSEQQTNAEYARSLIDQILSAPEQQIAIRYDAIRPPVTPVRKEPTILDETPPPGTPAWLEAVARDNQRDGKYPYAA